MTDDSTPTSANLAVLALGSNLGDRASTLASALRGVGQLHGTRVLRVSPWYETDPVGGPAGQPAFLNGAALVETSLSPDGLLKALLAIEQAHGARGQGRMLGAVRHHHQGRALFVQLTQQVHDRTPALAWKDAGRDYALKGFDAPIRLYAASGNTRRNIAGS